LVSISEKNFKIDIYKEGAPMSLLVCFGDHMIANEVERDGTPKLTPRLRKNLQDWIVINAGSMNETITTSLFRFQDDVLRYNPDVVTISFGLNHSELLESLELLEVEKNLLIMVQKIQPNKTILITPPPNEVESMTRELIDKLDAYVSIVKKVAKLTNCHIIDLWNIADNKKKIISRNNLSQQYTYSLLSELVVDKVKLISKKMTAEF
jgi:lysophospholipase L1-like esterase